jgi:7,8-dihydropterin-6-yl-methyl-4-(beta-D-ribofuranosyl)aminobenzene 5'-phosphate synthase
MVRFIIIIAVFLFETVYSQIAKNDGERSVDTSTNKAAITVVYDNYPFMSGLKTAWGFSCVIEFQDKHILFDTGGDGQTLLFNMEQLDIDPKEIDAVVLSHIHGDHVGGLFGFLKRNSRVVVYLPKSFPENFKDKIESYGARFEEIDEDRKLFDNIYTTGELGTRIREQSLILHTAKGPVIITGCAHPGIVRIIEQSIKQTGADPLLVVGGFHLKEKSDSALKQIIDDFVRLRVRKAGPSHCSGDRARRLFQDAYGENYIEVGVGKTITIDP